MPVNYRIYVVLSPQYHPHGNRTRNTEIYAAGRSSVAYGLSAGKLGAQPHYG